jgi:Asp-tRNA(Asn)/Glu-tRNA(Gln) amidotransferase A subunit family amidase
MTSRWLPTSGPPEFGAGANTVNDVYGFTGNPFDPNRSCAGSSGGSAVALAAGMVPLATGSDLGGSLRTPAAYCGVVGFRSTPGLIGDPTKRFAWWPLSVEGPMARSVEDLALLLSVMAAERAGDALSQPGGRPDFLDLPEVDLSRLRVAVSADLGFAPLDDSIRKVFEDRAGTFCGLFAGVERRDPPLDGANRTFEVLRGIGFLAGYRKLFEEQPDMLGPNVTANVKLGLGFSPTDVAEAMKTQSETFRHFAKFMDSHDVLICPTASVSPIAKGQLYPKEINGRPLETYISWLAITYSSCCRADWTMRACPSASSSLANSGATAGFLHWPVAWRRRWRTSPAARGRYPISRAWPRAPSHEPFLKEKGVNYGALA